MSIIYDLEHITTYSYRNLVSFGKHRAIFLPSAGHGERILSYSVQTNVPSAIRWIIDTLSNNVAEIEFKEPAKELIVTCRLQAEHFGMKAIAEFPLAPRAQSRETEGTQSLGETLRLQSGTCRDYAWLMIEALRRLGLACRSVSGYLYDAALDGGIGMIG